MSADFRLHPRWLAWLCVLGGAALQAGNEAEYQPPAPGSYKLPVIRLAAGGALLDSSGREVRLEELTRGRITVLSFIYTRCRAANACPAATGVLNQLHELSATEESLAKNLRLVSMSFDPEHDTPATLAAYSQMAAARSRAAEWRFVTAPDKAALEPILTAYDQAVDRKADAADPLGPLSHTLRVYLIDPEGRIRNIYSSGTLHVRLVLADIRTLAMEAGG
jgi:cytochrome oxidase Cu insertion factor (SCO1/SenC/PrrC family)